MKMLDLFSGIGGFHEGFKRAGYQFDWVGFSEIDKYASAVYKYNYKESEELGDIKLIRPGRDLPDNIDILCGGFPCQAFSVAGKRLGFNDTRGTLFFEIARILTYFCEKQRPIKCLVLENVKGLLSHDDGRTFATIYRVLDNLGYTIEFQLLNTRWWKPQNRERIYIVGYIGNSSGPQVFPIGENGEVSDYTSRKNHRKAARKQNGYSRTISSRIHKMGCEDTYIIDKKGNKKNNQDYAATLTGGSHIGGNHSDMDLIKVPEATKKGYAEAEEGDSINLSVPNSKTRRGRVGKGEAQTLDTGMQQYTIQAKSVAHRTRTYAGQPAKIEERDDNVSNALNSAMKDSMVKIDTNIRRLTPVECNRLQGFSDDHNKYGVMDGKVVEMSDTQRYKQAGNAVTVDVVQAVATIIKEKELV
jgi:DNA (cytosine-5)-methyltransferase 1